jgi:hypothetical protein
MPQEDDGLYEVADSVHQKFGLSLLITTPYNYLGNDITYLLIDTNIKF